ncbi:BatD family protein [Chlamydiota bacterium]
MKKIGNIVKCCSDNREKYPIFSKKVISLNMKLLVFFVFIMVFVFITNGLAAEIEISATLDKKKIPINGSAVLRISLSGNDKTKGFSNPEVPPVEGLSIYGSGTSQNISIINGKMTAFSTYIYTVVPKAMGKFRIPSVGIVIDGNEYKTDSIELEVVKATALRVSPTKERLHVSDKKGQQVKDAQSGRLVFVSANVDKKTVYLDEQVTFSFRFYRKINLHKRPHYGPPSTEGFLVEDLPPERVFYQYVSGERYLVQEIKIALFPTETGELTIGPAQLECVVPAPRKRIRNRDPFDLFDEDPFSVFGSDPFEFLHGKKVVLSTDPVTITVLPLPREGKPVDFSGMVGSFTFNYEVSQKEVSVNQPITLRIEVSGQGNLKTLPDFDLSQFTDFKIYDSGGSFDLTKDDFIIGGRKIIEKALIPFEPGNKEISGLRFSYFDPFKKEYKAMVAPPINITVLPSEEKKEELVEVPMKKKQQDISFVKHDIHHIRSGEVDFSSQVNIDIAKLVLFNALILGVFLLIAGSKGLKIHHEKNEVVLRTKKAYKVAKKKLSDAKKLIKEERRVEFYHTLSNTMRAFLGDKLSVSQAGLRFSDIQKKIQGFCCDDVLLTELRHCLESADMARFSSSRSTKEQMEEDLKKAYHLLMKLERLPW